MRNAKKFCSLGREVKNCFEENSMEVLESIYTDGNSGLENKHANLPSENIDKAGENENGDNGHNEFSNI